MDDLHLFYIIYFSIFLIVKTYFLIFLQVEHTILKETIVKTEDTSGVDPCSDPLAVAGTQVKTEDTSGVDPFSDALAVAGTQVKTEDCDTETEVE